MSSEGPAANGAERLVAGLVGLGVEVVFGLPGVHNLAIWEALASSGIQVIGVRHEQTAVYAADGYFRASGRLGVALVTTGPGAANTAAAMGEAYASGSGVLLVATEIATSLRLPGVNRGVLHEADDQGAIFESISKQVIRIAAGAEISSSVSSSAASALAAPTGPVYLGVPTDLLATEAEQIRPPSRAGRVSTCSEKQLERAAGLLNDADKVLIWAGGGALRSDSGPVVGELAEALAAPVVTTYGARGLLPPNHPCAVPGPVHASPIGRLWDEADLVLAVGTDFDGMMTQNWAMPKPQGLLTVNVDQGDAAKNYAPDLALVGDAAYLLSILWPMIARRDHLDLTRERIDRIMEEISSEVAADEPAAASFLDGLDRALPDETVVVADMCVAGYWAAGYRRVPMPRKLAYPVGWGTLGFGFPAALGAARANEGPVVCICGDGGFLFGCGELATLAESNLPVTVVLVDDGGYGMLRYDQEHAGQQAFGVDLHTPDFVALAGAFGVSAEIIDGFGSRFDAALSERVAGGGPSVLVVRARLKPPPTTSPRWYRLQERAASL